jgi:hypothetical protein
VTTPFRFLIATSCRNAEAYIDETVASIAGQRGEFAVRYHVQDAGSSEGTLDKLAAWQARFANGSFPLGCREFRFTVASAPDRGLYDGLNAAFRVLAAEARDGDWMSWLNASDRYLPGTFQTVAEIASDLSGTRWLTGLPSTVTEAGSHRSAAGHAVFATRCLADGLHDGRHMLHLVQQEGTFWRHDLWRQAGGAVDAALRLAGDFDLWVRFAKLSPLLGVQAQLGQFRAHQNRLSGEIDRYFAEVEAIDDGRLAAVRDATWEQFKALHRKGGRRALREEGFTGEIARRDPQRGVWIKQVDVPEPIQYELVPPRRIEILLAKLGLAWIQDRD